MTTTLRRRPASSSPEAGRLAGRLRPTWNSVVLLAAAVITFALLLAAPVKGLTNNGDYQRLMQALGVQALSSEPLSATQLTQYYVTGLPISEPVPPGGNTAAERAYYYGTHGYASSQLLVDKAAIDVGTGLGNPKLFDIRWIGAANGLVLIFGIGLVLLALRQLARPVRIVVGLLVALAFTDFGYVEYMNSFFSEPSELTFLLAAVGSAGAVPVLRGGQRTASFVCYVVCTGLFVWSKEGDYINAVPLAVLAPLLAWRYFGRWWSRAIALASCPVLAVAIWLSIGTTIPYFQALSDYDSVFNGIMLSAPNPQVAAQELGLDPSLAQYSGYNAYQSADNAFAAPGMQAGFFDRITYSKLVKFYAEHPATLLTALSQASDTSLDLRVPYLSNMAGSANVNYATDSPWTVLHADILPHSLWFIIAVPSLTVSAGVAGLLRRRRRTGPASAELLIALGLMAILNFAEPVVADGFNELIKHHFLFNVTFDMCLIADVAVLLAWLASFRGWPDRPPPDAGSPGADPAPVGQPGKGLITRSAAGGCRDENWPSPDHRLPPSAHERWP